MDSRERKINGQEILFGYSGHPIGGIAVAIGLFEGDHIAIAKKQDFFIINGNKTNNNVPE